MKVHTTLDVQGNWGKDGIVPRFKKLPGFREIVNILLADTPDKKKEKYSSYTGLLSEGR